MIKHLCVILAGVALLLPALMEGQMRIIRKGGDGKNLSAQEDIAELPELAAILVAHDGKLVVDNVFDKKMRPKEYESVDLRQGDVIMMMNGKRVKSTEEFKNVYSSIEVGGSVKLGVQRDEETMIVSFDKADPKKLPKRNIVIRNDNGSDTDDMMMIPNTGVLIGAKGKRVFVDRILTDIPSSLKDADVKEGDDVTAINGTNVASFKEFSDAFKKIDVGQKVTLTTSRKGKELSFSFTKAEGGRQRIIKREQ